MPNTFTANYTLTKPEVGAATNQWGGLINSNFDTIDTQIKARDTQAAAAQATANAALARSGGTMTGFITLHANPSSNFHPATKEYVDAFLLKAGGNMTGFITLHSAPVNEFHPANKKYVDDAVAQAQIQAGAGLPLTGGAMQGYITLHAAPVSNLHAATKKYVDDGDAAVTVIANAALSKAGGTMTGPIILSADPNSASDSRTAVTKNYVDTIFLPKSGGVLTGNLTLFADPTTDMQPVTLRHFNTNALRLSGGAMTGHIQLFSDPVQANHPVTLQYLNANTFSRTQTASQSMAGPLILSADPTGLSGPLQAATKNYVDTSAVPRAGTGSTPMTGYLSLVGDPTQNNHAATKAYVDAADYLDPDLKLIAGLTGAGFLKRGSGGSWSLDANNITFSGDASGTGTSSISLTLANSGVSAGNYNTATSIHQLTIDAKGRVTAVGLAQTITPAWASITSKPTTVAGFGITDALTTASASVTYLTQAAAASTYLTTATASSTYLPAASGTFAGTMSGGSISLNASTGAIGCSTLTASGDITAFSDARIKDDVRSISDALALISRLRGVSYVRKDSGRAGVGVIAQEVEDVIPAVVTTHDDGMKSVAYGNIVGILIEAIKELAQRVEELEAR